MTRNIWALGIALIVFGALLAFRGVKESNLAATASQVPEEITLEKLIARGAEGNPNIILTNYSLGKNFVFTSKNGRWTSAWVPAVPSTGGAPLSGQPGNIRALIFSVNANNEKDLYQRCGQPRLRVLVTNMIVSLDSKEKNLLEQSYPGTDFSRCLLIQEGEEPASASKVLLKVGGGILLVMVGLGILGFELWRWQATHRPPPRPRKRRRQIEEDDEEDEAPRRRRNRSRPDDY